MPRSRLALAVCALILTVPTVVVGWQRADAAFEAQRARLGDEHEALHRVLDCLGETIWRAQRDRQPPDGAAYVACVRAGLDE